MEEAIECTPPKLDQTEVIFRDLSDCDCNFDSELEEEQTKTANMNAWKILTNYSELELRVADPC